VPDPIRELSADLGFAGNPLDRLSELRDDPAAIAALAARAEARCLILVRDQVVLRSVGEALDPWFLLPQARELGPERAFVLLGRVEAGPRFGLLLEDEAATVDEPADEGAMIDQRRMLLVRAPDLPLLDLRTIGLRRLLGRADVAVLSQAKSLLHWHNRHGFCANCGAPTSLAAGGWRRDCEACRAQHFPRTDPVVIMLITDGDRCLLGRQARFGKGMYSALAGFLEPGETIEEAVRREVREEAGIMTGRVTYVASQPWPFPSSLMIGCIGEALSTQIVLDQAELEDARWFSRSEAETMLAGRHADGLGAPQPIAIAHHLLRHWVSTPTD
jgi:NAD+ diphosphatase